MWPDLWGELAVGNGEVRGNQLRVIRVAETRTPRLSEQELIFLQQLHNPGPVKSCAGYSRHSPTLVCLAPQGGWALTPVTLPAGHPGRRWSQQLWETLAYFPNESFEGVGLRQGRPVLKTSQGWCDLQLRPCPGPEKPTSPLWHAVDETGGMVTPQTVKDPPGATCSAA